MDFSVSALSASRTFRIIPAQLFSAHPFAAEVAWFSGASTYTRYPCLRAVAHSAVGTPRSQARTIWFTPSELAGGNVASFSPRSQARTIWFTPSELAGGNVASFHCTNTVLHADGENMTQTHNTTMFLKLMRSVLEP